MDGRPPTSAGNRPVSSLRPFTSTRRPVVHALPSRAGIPGTATRLVTSSSNRPNSRGGIAQGIGVMAHINVVDRPMSQQGLVTPKTGVRAPRRQVQDKSYFMGLLRSKITELVSEIGRMNKEIDLLSKEQSTYLTYEKRAEAMATELKALQGQLGDYNLLVDKLNTDTEMADVQEEYKELKGQNETEAENIDKLFEQRQMKELQLRQLEGDIKQEHFMADNLIASMKPELQVKYADLKQKNNELLSALDQLQQKLDSLATRKNSLEEELSMSQVKQDAVALYGKLREVKMKRDSIIEEEKVKGTPAQERERLLQQVKDDNAELASIERQTAEMKEQISRAKDELEQLEQELEDHQGERVNKYRELKKREETMDSFLSSFEENKISEIDRKGLLEATVVSLLEKVSRNLAHFQHLPSPQELAALKDDLSFKEGEMEKSRITVVTLSQEQKKLTVDLSKIEQLETKIQQELETLQQKITTMETEMATYSDLNKLRNAAEEKKAKLIADENVLKSRKDVTKKVVAEMNVHYEILKNKLHDNETFVQLSNLERRWQHLEQNNFSMRDFIAAKKSECDYSSTKESVKFKLSEINKAVQDTLLQKQI